MDELENGVLELQIPSSYENLQLPNPYLLGYYKDADNRTYWVSDEINDDTLEICKEILRINREDKCVENPEDRIPIKLFINSYGGDLTACYTLIDVILASKTPVITINAGIAYSAGALILMAGSTRLCLPHSRCLIHEGSASFSGSHSEIEEAQKSYSQMVGDMRKYILSRTTIDSKLFVKNAKKDWYVDSDESVTYGICDRVITDITEVL